MSFLVNDVSTCKYQVFCAVLYKENAQTGFLKYVKHLMAN